MNYSEVLFIFTVTMKQPEYYGENKKRVTNLERAKDEKKPAIQKAASDERTNVTRQERACPI